MSPLPKLRVIAYLAMRSEVHQAQSTICANHPSFYLLHSIFHVTSSEYAT